MSEVVLVHGNHIHEQLRLAVDKVVVIDKKMEDAAAWMVKESPYVA